MSQNYYLSIAFVCSSALIVGALFYTTYGSALANEDVDQQEILNCVTNVRSQFSQSGPGMQAQDIFNSDLEEGDSGEEVALLHQVLNCDPRTELEGPIEYEEDPDGRKVLFNETTRDALERFQDVYNLPETGQIMEDDDTFEHLNDLTSSSFVERTSIVYGGSGFSAGATRSFGGMVNDVIYCTCTGGAVVVVGPPRGGRFLYHPGTTDVFEYGQIPVEDVWLLGNYAPGGICLRYDGDDCNFVPQEGIITIVGTSR